eukprot:1081370-Ditylum_brightwellii.AAC.1
MSAKFLFAPPDAAGFIPDDEYKTIFTSYLGLPRPVCAPFIGQWIGSEGKQRKIDEHGDVVSARNAVPGAGHTIAHKYIQVTASNTARAAGMQVQPEAEKLFHGRVQEPCIGRYCEHYLNRTAHDCTAHKDTIIPDLLNHNYQVGDERHKDGNGTSQASTPAIFEVKGIHVGKNQQVRYPARSIRGTDMCGSQAQQEYTTKAK